MTMLLKILSPFLITALIYLAAFVLGNDRLRTKIFSRRYRDFFSDVKDFETIAEFHGNRRLWNRDDFCKRDIEATLKRYFPSDYTPALYLNLLILMRGIGEESTLNTECRLLAVRHLLQFRGMKEYKYLDTTIPREELIEYLHQHGEEY